MGYNNENYRRIRAAYKTKYLKAYEEAERRTAELHTKSAEVAEIDRQLRSTGAEIAMAALGTGADYRSRLAAVEARNLELQKKRSELLQKMGYPADYTKPPYECELCRDSGFVDTKMCECMRRELVLAAFASSGLGELMRSQSFDSFSLEYYNGEDRMMMERNLELLKAYAEGFDAHADSLILCGATGLGKTHLSTAVARRVIERGFDVYYTGAIQMFSDFEFAKFGSGTGEHLADPARYVDCDLLILDDLGTEVTNQFTNSCLYMILDNRINLRRPTIINTNLTGKEIKARYTDRIASRILGTFKPLLFAGTDVRRQKLTNK
ncbi:MAG: ATP-binding protein [Clostridia bacterium]|nr:ATP-binding protein [Clostridia bacterium]